MAWQTRKRSRPPCSRHTSTVPLDATPPSRLVGAPPSPAALSHPGSYRFRPHSCQFVCSMNTLDDPHHGLLVSDHPRGSSSIPPSTASSQSGISHDPLFSYTSILSSLHPFTTTHLHHNTRRLSPWLSSESPASLSWISHHRPHLPAP